jgi:hypothetical protein
VAKGLPRYPLKRHCSGSCTPIPRTGVPHGTLPTSKNRAPSQPIRTALRGQVEDLEGGFGFVVGCQPEERPGSAGRGRAPVEASALTSSAPLRVLV